jgi:predicted porin
MKKSLLALAALGAFAGAASAQSSVTVFGVVDASVNYIDNGGQKTWMLASNQLNSNRLGFRGVEDLGGGLQAGFWLEMGMDNATGWAGGSSGNVSNGDGNSSQLFNRRSTVSLMGKWGEVRLGRDYNPSFWNWVFFDVNGANGLGQALNLATSLTADVNTLARTNNTIGYFLPSGLGGLYGQFMYGFGQSPTGTSGNQYQGGRLGWAAGPFDIAGAYSETETGPNAHALSSAKFKVTNIGASWNFGVAKLYGLWNEYKWDSAKQDTWGLSVGVPIGAGEFRAAYASADRQGHIPKVGTDISNDDAKMFSLEYVYNLSKRTALYTTYGQINNDGKAAFTVMGGSPTGTGLAGGTSKGYNVGVRHSF